MSSDQFHNFPKLPGELRWMIWQDAICTSPMPRIHYCSLRKDSRELNRSLFQSTIVCPAGLIPYTYDRPSWHQHDIVEANKPVHQVNDGWVKATRYRNYWDFGLRTACRESRRAVLPSYRPFVTDGWVPRLAKIGEDVVQMLMDPDADIICLELSPEELKETVKLDWSTLIFRLPIYQHPPCLRINIAFEYDESWDKALTNSSPYSLLKEPSTPGFMLRAFWAWVQLKLPRHTTIWLIEREWHPPAATSANPHGTHGGPHRELQHFYDGEKEWQENDEKPSLTKGIIRGASSFSVAIHQWHQRCWLLPNRHPVRDPVICVRTLRERSTDKAV